MKNTRQILRTIFVLFAFLVLISKNSSIQSAVAEGVDLCFRTVIPSLFPFIVLSAPMLQVLLDSNSPLLHSIGRMLGITQNAEGVIIIGLLGGYPMGAKTIGELYRRGDLPREEAERLLAFSCNCGPAFLFGLVSRFFPDYSWVLYLWTQHILSAFIIAVLLPHKKPISGFREVIAPKADIESSMKAMSIICGWVIVFRCVIAVLQPWIRKLSNEMIYTLFLGLLELSNGILLLSTVDSVYLRFFLAVVLINFGGICVCAQTASVIGGLKLRTYLLGKILQSVIGCIITGIVFTILQKTEIWSSFLGMLVGVFVSAACFTALRKIILEISKSIMYNERKSEKMEEQYAVS